MDQSTTRTRSAFTLVEILIVVLILGILGAIVLPKFSNASSTARNSMLLDDIRIMRIQLEVFRGQHVGVPAGYPDCDRNAPPTADAFVDHMTQSSNPSGETAPPGTPGFRYGPYFRQIPPNPVNEKNTVRIIADGEPFPEDGQDTDGWIYQPSTLTLKPDLPGTDENGKSYMEY